MLSLGANASLADNILMKIAMDDLNFPMAQLLAKHGASHPHLSNTEQSQAQHRAGHIDLDEFEFDDDVLNAFDIIDVPTSSIPPPAQS